MDRLLLERDADPDQRLDEEFDIPPSVSEILTKVTDVSGAVRFPSRLTEEALVFRVEAKGFPTMLRSFPSPSPRCLFVLGGDGNDSERYKHCLEKLSQELYVTPEDIAVGHYLRGLTHYGNAGVDP